MRHASCLVWVDGPSERTLQCSAALSAASAAVTSLPHSLGIWYAACEVPWAYGQDACVFCRVWPNTTPEAEVTR